MSEQFKHLSFYFMHAGCREIDRGGRPAALTRQLSNSTDNTIRCFIQGFPENVRPFLIKYFNDNSNFENMSMFYDYLRRIKLFDRWIEIMDNDRNMYSIELYNIIVNLSQDINSREIRKLSIRRMDEGDVPAISVGDLSEDSRVLVQELPDTPGLTMEPDQIRELGENSKLAGKEVKRGSVVLIPDVTEVIRNYKGNGYTAYHISMGGISYYKRFSDFEKLKTDLNSADGNRFKELKLDELWPEKTWWKATESIERARMHSFHEIFGNIYDEREDSKKDAFVTIIQSWLEQSLDLGGGAKLKSKKRIKHNKTRNRNIKKLNKKRGKTKRKIKRKKTILKKYYFIYLKFVT